MRIHEIMENIEPSLSSIQHDISVKEAVMTLFDKKAHALLVTDDSNMLIGIITERDIAKALGEHGRNTAFMPVSEIMSLDLLVCDPNQSIQQVLALMGQHKVRDLPIVAANGHMLGMVGIMELVYSVLK